MSEDYYSILGVEKNASKEEIKKAYKKLAKKYHPDISDHKDSEEKLKEINHAYSVLGDDQKRQKYDTYGSAAFDGRGPQGFSGGAGGFGFDFSDIFSSFMGEDIFSQFAGRNSHGFRQSRQSLDLKIRIDIDFLFAAKGGKKEIILTKDSSCEKCGGTGSQSMKKHTCDMCSGRGQIMSTKQTPFGVFSVQQTCPKCKGEGQIISDPCPYCKGKGYTKQTKTITIDIPAGIDTGDVIRLRGLGNEHKTHKGDLFVHVLVHPHSFFKRDGPDLYCEIPVTYTDLILGTTIKIKGIQDKIKLKIPSHTESGTIFKIKGKGLPDIHRRNVHGSLFVKVNVVIPKKVNKDYKSLVKKLSKIDDKEIKNKLYSDYKEFIEVD